MAKKLDLTRPKEFLFRYGERIALFSCIGLALLLMLWGILGASGPGTQNGESWDKALNKAATMLKAKMPPADAPDLDVVKKEVQVPDTDWSRLAMNAQPGPYISLGEKFDSRRRNPKVLEVMAGDQNFQVDFLHRGFVGYEVRNGKVLVVEGGAGDKLAMGALVPGGQANAAGAAKAAAHVLKPRRILVVSAVFPMQQQVEEYVKALRYSGVGDLYANKEMPRVLGINVIRQETGPDGKTINDSHKLIYLDAEGKLIVDPALDKELSEAIYEEANPKALAAVIHPGLVTPLPQLPAGVRYPKLRIQGPAWPELEAPPEPEANVPGQGPAMIGGAKPPPIGIAGMKDGKPPEMGGPELGAEPKTETVSLKKFEAINKDLAMRLGGAYNIFHPFGEFPNKAAPAVADAPQMPVGGPLNMGTGGATLFGFDAVEVAPAKGDDVKTPMKMPKGFDTKEMMAPGKQAAGTRRKIYDALVRFVDVDVKPHHTYRYAIQVRLENPNADKKNDVVQQDWAALKELGSQWTWSKAFTVPGTYDLFAVDQVKVDAMGGKDAKRVKAELKKIDGEHAAVQLHRWFGRGGESNEYLIGDWAIFERLVVRKGAPIGKAEMIVEVPTWNSARGAFEMKSTLPTHTKGPKAPKAQPGVPLDFVPVTVAADGKTRITAPPMLVDFEGGRRAKIGFPEEQAAVELLILSPDGRLIVHSARADLDAAIDDGTPEGTTRQRRVEEARRRNRTAGHSEDGGGNVGRPRPIGGGPP